MPGTLVIPSAQVSPDGPFKVERGKHYVFSTVLTDLDFIAKWDNEKAGNAQRKYALDYFKDVGWSPDLYLWIQTGEPRLAWPKEELPYSLGSPDVVPVLRGSGIWDGPTTLLDRDYFANGLILWIGVWPTKPRAPGDPIVPLDAPKPQPSPGPGVPGPNNPNAPGVPDAPAPATKSGGVGIALALGVFAAAATAALMLRSRKQQLAGVSR